MRATMKVKEWVIEKAQQTAGSYNCYIDYERDENNHGLALRENGYITVYVEEFLSESEKAMQVRLSTGSVVGSYKGWKLWIPKSQIGGVYEAV